MIYVQLLYYLINHLSNITCLAQVFFKRGEILKPIMVFLDTTKHA